MAALDGRQPLLSFVRRNGRIPTESRGIPWFPDGNIFLFTEDRAFKFYMGLLRARNTSPWFEQRLQNLSDDSVDLVDNYPAILLDDASRDLGNFLMALSHGCGKLFTLESEQDFIALSGILRLATKYHVRHMREDVLRAFRLEFPSNLVDWDRIADSALFRWTCDPIPVINLARELSAVFLIPPAMAFLTNDASAGEVFGVPVHEGTRRRIPLHPFGTLEDIQGFALMKEYNHVSIVRMITFVRNVGRDCKQPPEPEPRPRGMSPVGTQRGIRPSICSKGFHRTAGILTLMLVTEDPIGYRDFCIEVWLEVMEKKLAVCRRCRRNFETGYGEHRRIWWAGIARILGVLPVEHPSQVGARWDDDPDGNH